MPGRKEKLFALLLAVLLQALLLIVIFWAPVEDSQGQAKAAGTGGVEISLGPAGSAAGGPKQLEGSEQAEPEAKPKPKPKPEPKPEPEAKPKPEPKPEPKPKPKPEPKPKPVQDVLPKTETPVVTEQQQAAPPPAMLADTNGKSGTRDAQDNGSGNNTAGGGQPGETEDYAATLLAWLEKHREYPRRARMRRQEGTVLLSFVIDRNGRVLEHRIEKSSGFSILDDEVLKMLERAQPLPGMPEHLDREQLALVVPVQFYLR
jgi:protein TonB